MKLEDFCIVHWSNAGKTKVIKYEITNALVLKDYFVRLDNKPSVLAKTLGIHYQSCRKLLQDCNLWYKVETKNGKGTGPNSKRLTIKDPDGYLYSKDPKAYNLTFNKDGSIRSRRKREHIDTVEKYLDRKLNKEEVVHHINGVKTDNNIDNLLVTNKSEHKKLHCQLELLALGFLKTGHIVFDRKKRRYQRH